MTHYRKQCFKKNLLNTLKSIKMTRMSRKQNLQKMKSVVMSFSVVYWLKERATEQDTWASS